MDTRNLLQMRQSARGAAKPLLIAIISVIVLVVVGAWFLIIKPHQQMVLEDSGGHPSTPVSASTLAAALPPPANVAAMDVNQLLDEARKAIIDQRYLAPKGNNAFEFYLKVLEKQPGNQVASDALRETFPYAATSAEQVINARNFDESQRQIDLLAKADPANFTLTILRSKLDAQRKVLDKQQQQVLDQQKAQQVAQQAAQQKAAAEKLEAEKIAEQQKIQAAELALQKPRTTRAATAAGAAEAKPAASEANGNSDVATSGKTSDAALIKGAEPIFPANALRAHQAGWAVVAFTIDPNGRTSDVHVTSSQPKRVFDRAAIDAVSRYRFTPAMKNGEPVPTVREQRIEFNL